MNNRQLQEAIDKARKFVAETSTANSGPWWDARMTAQSTLKELEKIQVARAAMVMAPRLTLGDIK